MAKKTSTDNEDRLAAMTAGMERGEPNPKALEEVEKANAQAEALRNAESDLTPLVDTAPAAPEVDAPTAPPAGDLASLFREALADPSVKATLREVITADPELRDVLGIAPGRGAPSGEWRPRYDRVDNHVMGGLEVAHEPGFEPLPPAAIPVYITDDKYRAHAKATTPLKHLAKKGPDGRPVKTEQYKMWLDLKSAGRRMTRNEIIDIEKQNENGPQLAIGDDGAPVAVDSTGAEVFSGVHDEAL